MISSHICDVTSMSDRVNQRARPEAIRDKSGVMLVTEVIAQLTQNNGRMSRSNFGWRSIPGNESASEGFGVGSLSFALFGNSEFWPDKDCGGGMPRRKH